MVLKVWCDDVRRGYAQLVVECGAVPGSQESVRSRYRSFVTKVDCYVKDRSGRKGMIRLFEFV